MGQEERMSTGKSKPATGYTLSSGVTFAPLFSSAAIAEFAIRLAGSGWPKKEKAEMGKKQT